MLAFSGKRQRVRRSQKSLARSRSEAVLADVFERHRLGVKSLLERRALDAIGVPTAMPFQRRPAASR